MTAANNEETKYIIEIKTEEEFNQLLKRSKAILYFHVNWAAQELMSRRLVNKALWEIGVLRFPVFKIDASDRILFLENWIEKQKNMQPYFIYGGLGETVLLENGVISDFIKYPAQLGLEKIKEKIKSWQ